MFGVNSHTIMTVLGIIESRILLLMQLSAGLLRKEQDSLGLSNEGATLANNLSRSLPEYAHGLVNVTVIPPASDDFAEPVFEASHISNKGVDVRCIYTYVYT